MSDNAEFNFKEELRKLPKKPGVYLMHGVHDEIIYIGKAVNLYNRVHQYFQSPEGKSPKIRRMISNIRRFEYIVVDSELEALVLENNLIKENRPKYNTLLKDDKTYPYIKVTTGEAYPRIFMTRKFIKDGSRYFGPYTSSLSVKECLEMLHKLYRVRTCSRKLPEECGKERPCLYYHLGQCMGPCTGNVSREEYSEGIRDALEFLSGKYEKIKKILTDKMQAASEEMEFEKAIEYRELLKAVDDLSVRQKVTAYDNDDRDIIGLSQDGRNCIVCVFFIRGGVMTGRESVRIDMTGEETSEELVSEFIKRFYTGTPYLPKEIWIQCDIPERELLSRWLNVNIRIPKIGQKEKLVEMAVENAVTILRKDGENLKKEQLRTIGANNEIRDLLGLGRLERIESYDISNISGFENVGSMIVFVNGAPKNSDYRKFRIRTVEGPNDYASMREMLTRRFAKDENDTRFGAYPDLILMDGGKGQVGIAEKVIGELGICIPAAGMVKDDKHRTRGIWYKGKELPIDPKSEGFHLITRIQDETHRFAIEYHRSLRSKEQVHSILDDIPGVGPTRRRALLKYFRNIDLLKQADVEELLKAGSIDRRTAENIFAFFHNNN